MTLEQLRVFVAVAERQHVTLESFSSVGPGTELFDAQGNPLPAPATVGEPQFDSSDAAVVGSANTSFATNPFFGK